MAVNKQNQSHVETLVRKYVGARKAMFIIIIIIIIIIVIIISWWVSWLSIFSLSIFFKSTLTHPSRDVAKEKLSRLFYESSQLFLLNRTIKINQCLCFPERFEPLKLASKWLLATSLHQTHASTHPTTYKSLHPSTHSGSIHHTNLSISILDDHEWVHQRWIDNDAQMHASICPLSHLCSHPPIYPVIHPSVHLFIHPSSEPAISLSIYLPSGKFLFLLFLSPSVCLILKTFDLFNWLFSFL